MMMDKTQLVTRNTATAAIAAGRGRGSGSGSGSSSSSFHDRRCHRRRRRRNSNSNSNVVGHGHGLLLEVLLLLLQLIFVVQVQIGVVQVHACTVFAVGRAATYDGSVMVSHSNDGEFDTDPRLVKVNSADYDIESSSSQSSSQSSSLLLRPIYYSPETYPRYVGYERNITEYYPKEEEDQISFKPIGYIPQVSHTYAYLEETYGAVNEMQVGIGESTCSGIFGAAPIGQQTTGNNNINNNNKNGTALLSIDELTKIAMERSSTARQAIEIMGALAEEYGFYGAGEFEGTAESLAVSDTNEVWIFHILADPTGKSAIWVAEKIDDNKFVVIANMFIIRQVDPLNTEKYMMSDSVHSVAKEYGWWTSIEKDGLLDFTKIYSDGEYSHKYYSGRRVWGAYRLVSPSLDLPSEYIDDLQSNPVYPFSVVPDKKLSQKDLFTFHRDTYSKTKYDLSSSSSSSSSSPSQSQATKKGGNLAGGPFGSPDRWKAGPNEAIVKGNWERPIGLYRTSDTYIVQSKAVAQKQKRTLDNSGSNSTLTTTTTTSTGDAILWFGPSSPLATVFVPFIVRMSDIPASFRSGHQSIFSRSSAFWAACYVHNIANLKWSYMIHDISKKQNELEHSSIDMIKEIFDKKEENQNHQGAEEDLYDIETIEDMLIKNAEKIVTSLWLLADELMFKYADGFVNSKEESKQVGYPTWWLEKVGYEDGPPPPPTIPKCCNPPKNITNTRIANHDDVDNNNMSSSFLLRGGGTDHL
ncbi:MAG: dipeptidase [Bacillariaceae sp.]|jgi:dipeptidase